MQGSHTHTHTHIYIYIYIYLFIYFYECCSLFSPFQKTYFYIYNKKPHISHCEYTHSQQESVYKHCFMQKEDTLMLLIQQVPSRQSILHYTICKTVKIQTPTLKILHINSPRRQSHNTNKFHQIRQPKTQQLHFINFKDFVYLYIMFYCILYFNIFLLIIYKLM